VNFELTEDQASVLVEIDRLVDGLSLPPHTEPVISAYCDALDHAVADAGFLEIAHDDNFGLLDAALVTERLARLPHIIEAATSAIVAPALGLSSARRPYALVAGDATKPARFLPKARTLIVDMDDHALAFNVESSRVIPVESLFAYPYGRLESPQGLRPKVITDVGLLRRRWQIAIACEVAGCMAGALSLVIEHVQSRRAFGRPLGAFQAIQHRLAMAAETVESCRLLAFRAAWADDDMNAAIAAAFAQSRISQFTYDLHQFTGAMGLTLEYPLHLWTYRLRALVSELGGPSSQARIAAATTWPEPRI
jgi:hypothetical protein